MITVIHEQRETQVPQAQADGDALWLDAAGIEQATGWTWKPEGLCRDEQCVPLAALAARGRVRGGQLDVAAAWRHAGHPVVHDADSRVWVLGTGAAQRAQALAALEVPDFALPDVNGQVHRLSAYRGRKVLLATWASW